MSNCSCVLKSVQPHKYTSLNYINIHHDMHTLIKIILRKGSAIHMFAWLIIVIENVTDSS